jgi:hypothetical protein
MDYLQMDEQEADLNSLKSLSCFMTLSTSRNSGALTVDQGIREITARREKRETEKERKKKREKEREREGEGEAIYTV